MVCMKKVGVIMGSDSDLPVVEKAIDKLKEYGVPTRSTSTPPTGLRSRPGTFPALPRKRALALSLLPLERPPIWLVPWQPTPRCR